VSSPVLVRQRRGWLPLGCVILVALLARLLFASGAPVFLEGDSQSYLLPAWELAHGEGFNPELRRAPGYPLLVAASLRLFGDSLERLALLQHSLGLAAVVLTYLLARRLFGTLAALLAGLAVALAGPQLIYERYVMTEALFGSVLIAGLLAMVDALAPAGGRAPLAGRAGRLLLAGALLALAALVRPIAQAILPLFLLACLALLPRWRPALTAAGLVVVGYGLVFAPWMLRNLQAHETPSAAGGLGRSLIARTVKYDDLFDWKWLSETYDQRDDLAARERMLLYNKRRQIPAGRSVRPYQDALIRELGLSQAEADTAMRSIALEAIARRPLEYLRGSLDFTGQLLLGSEVRLQSEWKQRANKDWAEQWDNRLDGLVQPVAAWGSPDPAPGRTQSLLSALTDLYQPARLPWLLLPLSALGCLLSLFQPNRRPGLLVAAAVLLLLGLSAFLDGPVPRYRVPLEPLVTILAAGGISGRWALISSRRIMVGAGSPRPDGSTGPMTHAQPGPGPTLGGETPPLPGTQT
jgi:4-amino-4-deoxy-L-arabinose transferase-like glycosyltransferase